MALRPTSGSGDVVGPAGGTDNAAVRFDGATGKLVQDSAVTIADTSGNITCGTVNAVNVAAHAARHAPGGADSMFGAITNGHMLYKSSVALLGRHMAWALKTAGQTESASATTDVDDLLFTNLRANANYLFRFVLSYQSSVTTTGLRCAIDFSGTLSSIMYAAFASTSGTASGFVSNVTTSLGGLVGATGTGPGTTNTIFTLEGAIRTTSAGTLFLRFVRGVAAGSVTIQANSFGVLQEAT
jgi:hypothetical protein